MQNRSALAALKKMYDQDKGTTLKLLESETFVSPHQAYFIRLDGCSFHTFLKGVGKPFDPRITDAMCKTTGDLVNKFQAVTGYTSSDEISLVFPAVRFDLDDGAFMEGTVVSADGSKFIDVLDVKLAQCEMPPIIPDARDAKSTKFENDRADNLKSSTEQDKLAILKRGKKPFPKHKSKKAKLEASKVHSYNGRMQKLASVAAGYASSRFNYHLTHPESQWDDMPVIIHENMHSGEAYFDGRVVPCGNSRDLMETIYWRSNFDAFRNAISQIGLAEFSTKELHGVSVIQKIQKLLFEKEIDVLSDYHPRYVYSSNSSYLFGTWIKRKKYSFPATDLKTGLPVISSRTKLACGSFNWAEFSEDDRISFTMAKFWDEDTGVVVPLVDEQYRSKLF